MATIADWIEGARPRTLPNAVAPVVVGSAAAALAGGFVWWKALLALVVAVALIIGVNFANDYSDGVRGTDDVRVGPVRLVGAGLVAPARVKQAAFACFGVAAVAGIALSVTSAWWLLLIGAACVAGAWFYTGGTRPYGYAGFGEIAVFVFFGLVAVLGTEFVQAGAVTWAGVLGAVAVGAFSSAVLVSNNLRDIPTDAQTGKITLAVRLGDRRTRMLFTVLLAAPMICSAALTAVTGSPWPLLALIAAPPAVSAARPVLGGAGGAALIPALRDTGLAMLAWAIGTAIAFVLVR